MVTLKDIKSINFVGIGGIGMSAIARFFLSRGVRVSGYDKTETVLTKALADEGALIHYTDDVNLLDQQVQLVVYTPAIPANHTELNWYRNQGYAVVKRSDVLQIITESTFNICVAGTHGKTSTCTMIGHLLRHSGYGCNVFLGGISVNYGTNFWSSENDVCVVEADEFDRSFLKLSPNIAAVTSMDADHLDIYGTVENMEQAFVDFTQRVRSGGVLIRKHTLQKLNDTPIKRQLSYCLEAEPHVHDENCDHSHGDVLMPDAFAANIEVVDGGYRFDAHIAGQVVQDVRLTIGGLHNIENMLVAIAVGKLLKLDDEKIKAAVSSFQGVKRRFEYLINTTANGGNQVMIDDYAHHPEELRALIRSARQLFPQLKCTVVFQPHLFSRTNDLAKEFGEVLSMADEVVLLPIYPARELPMPGVTSAMIAQNIIGSNVQLLEKDEWVNGIDNSATELLITAGAGDIDTLLETVKNKLQNS